MPKFKVDQVDGEIVIAVGGDEPTVYKVTNGEVTVKQEEVDRFVSQVDGAKPVSGSPAADKKEN